MASRGMLSRFRAIARSHWRRALGRRMPDELVLAVTSACNARCGFCYYWKELDQGGPELTLDEFARVARSMDPFHFLWITGGEPFLREDLPEIIRAFAAANRISGVHIPTNGLLPERILPAIGRLQELAPDLSVKVLLTLQGPEDLHDALFGVPGAFRKAMAALERLAERSVRSPNLSVRVNTVLSSWNIGSFPELLEITKRLRVAGHVASPVRGAPRDARHRPPTAEQWRRVSELLIEHNRNYHPSFFGKGLRYRQALSRFIDQQNLFMRLLSGQGLPFHCAAGDAIAVIEAGGDVRICELKGRAANLRDCGLDFRRLWSARPLAEARAGVPGCSCTHACFIGASRDARLWPLLKSLLASRLTSPHARA